MLVLVHPETANIFRKIVGLPEAAWTKEEEKNKKKEDDKSYFHNSSSDIQQHNNSKQSTISDFMI